MDDIDDVLDKATSVRFDHCKAIYEEMALQARQEDDQLIYEGYLTKLVQSLGLAAPYYSLVKRCLVPMGCVDQLRRGGSTTPSKWVLLREPTEEAFTSFDNTKRRARGRLAEVEQSTRLAHERATKLERDMTLALRRIQKLEALING